VHIKDVLVLTTAIAAAVGAATATADKVHLATTSGPEATGDGVKLAENMGAKLIDMDQIQVRMSILDRLQIAYVH
jgi:fumarate reductase flavoprotein subunit